MKNTKEVRQKIKEKGIKNYGYLFQKGHSEQHETSSNNVKQNKTK